MNNQDIVTRAETIYEAGYRAITVVMKDGSLRVKRLFKHGDLICVYKPKSLTRGYEISRFITHDWDHIKPYGPKDEDNIYDHFCGNLRKYQLAFTRKVHPNLWTDYQADYKRFSIEAFNAYVEGSQADKTRLNDLHEALHEYCKLFDINFIVFENRYKTTSIGAFVPMTGRHNYNACRLNIRKHLDNREDFHYYWGSSYDISVQGKTGADGKYRAWLSHEYKGKGNGHYYMLINGTTAVFTEDD